MVVSQLRLEPPLLQAILGEEVGNFPVFREALENLSDPPNGWNLSLSFSTSGCWLNTVEQAWTPTFNLAALLSKEVLSSYESLVVYSFSNACREGRERWRLWRSQDHQWKSRHQPHRQWADVWKTSIFQLLVTNTFPKTACRNEQFWVCGI